MKNRKKWLCMAACAVLMLSAALSGCSSPKADTPKTDESTAQTPAGGAETEGTTSGSETARDNEPASGKEPLTIGYTVQSMENAYFVSIVEGMEAAAKEQNIKLIVADAAADASKHVSQIEDFISQQVDAIIISPVDQQAPADAVKKAQEAGIPVISLDQEVEGSDAFFGISEEEYGRMGGQIAGNWLNEKEADGTIDDVLDSDGKIEVVVVRYDPISSVILRADGLKKGLEETYTGDKEIVYVSEQNAADAAQGFELAETALTANPEVSVFICINDSSALGVYESCLTHKEHTPENTCIVGLDALPEALKLVSQDTMYKGTVDIQPSQKGAQVFDIVRDVLANGPIEEQIVYDMSSVTKENIGDYTIE